MAINQANLLKRYVCKLSRRSGGGEYRSVLEEEYPADKHEHKAGDF